VVETLGADHIRALCERLSDDQRDVLLMRLLGRLTIDETAGLMRRTPGSVKALQRRGLLALSRLIEREGVPL
jgi:DNA-directed RNA polymerase specialized sigma24 family protein